MNYISVIKKSVKISLLVLVSSTGFSGQNTWSMEVTQSTKEVRILAIEGEGARALIPLVVLKNIEEQLQKKAKIQDYFNVIVGIDQGADSIADSLQKGESAKSLLQQNRDGQALMKVPSLMTEAVGPETNATAWAIQRVKKEQPGSYYTILTLGAGFCSSFASSEPTHPSLVKKTEMHQLLTELKGQGRVLDHWEIDVFLSNVQYIPSIQNAQAYIQAGNALCNSMNPNGHDKTIKTVVGKILKK